MEHNILKSDYEEINQNVEMQIARQCAPLLTGIKISNILITHVTSRDRVSSIFQDSPIKMKYLHIGSDRVAILLYRMTELVKLLQDIQVQRIMKSYGYQNMEVDAVLELFASRYSMYMKEREEFPHEMGILLGYPIEDVLGFIHNEGKNYLYTGYWKVYSNLYDTLHLFERFKYAKLMMVQLVMHGFSVNRIMEMIQTGEIREIIGENLISGEFRREARLIAV
ncbi:MAG TPA: DUF3793 family protein [Lachnospiraceae bacterium]|nr:DUF3793 family protein [Lachnospiraceae bacterium]